MSTTSPRGEHTAPSAGGRERRVQWTSFDRAAAGVICEYINTPENAILNVSCQCYSSAVLFLNVTLLSLAVRLLFFIYCGNKLCRASTLRYWRAIV